MARTFVLIGTGTSVGKTHVGERLLRAFAARGVLCVGYKPVESGVAGGEASDIRRLADASTFHVQPSLVSQTFGAPVSPHLAARWESRSVDLALVDHEIRRASASAAQVLLVELPGGAFSPLSDGVTGAEFARTLGATALLVTQDRLGVLHDVTATARACAALGLPLHGIVLNAPTEPDASTGHNEIELRTVTSVPVLACLPRTAPEVPVLPTDPVMGLSRLLFP
jgi:dethiobiotin synthetase